MGRVTVSILSALFFFQLLATTVHADKAKDAAKVHFNKGVKLYKSNDFTGALVEFQKAYEIKPNYTVLYNIAQCMMGLEQYREALETFEQYLEDGGDKIKKKRQEEVQEYISRIYDVLSHLMLTIDQYGALIIIDEETVGKTPHPGIIFLDAGPHTVRVEKEGYETFEEELLLSRGEKFSLQVSLKQELDEAGPEPEPETPAEGPSRKKISPVPFYVLVGATGALAIGFAVTGGLAVKKKNEFEDCYQDDPDCWRPLKDDHRKLAIATDILWPTAAATLTASVILAFFTDFKGGKERRAALVPGVSPEGMDLVLTVRF